LLTKISRPDLLSQSNSLGKECSSLEVNLITLNLPPGNQVNLSYLKLRLLDIASNFSWTGTIYTMSSSHIVEAAALSNTINSGNEELGVVYAESSKRTLEEATKFEWNTLSVFQALAVFVLAGIAEIGGGWMVWAAVRGNNNIKKPPWFAVVGSLVLIAYGFIPCLQPTDNFGRIYAVYGGFFIVLSLMFGWVLDGTKPDTGDTVGLRFP